MMRPLLANREHESSTKSNTRCKSICITTALLIVATFGLIAYLRLETATKHEDGHKYRNKTLYKHDAVIPSDASQASEYYKASGYDDEIVSMPNLEKSTCSSSATNCEFKQYSGYLLATNNAEIHYWFTTADTLDDPVTKPLFFWTNGGPGCSGMDGLLTEHGPWRVMDNLNIHYNEYAWNSEVNMVYLEQPYGVGFSTVSPGSSVVAGDQNAANDMDAVIRNFLSKFPEYANTPIYLSSESWGGHYVPITTDTILKNNDAGHTPYINFAGFLLGNPYTDWYENTYGFVGDIYGHGLLMGADWDAWRANCWDNEYNIDNDAMCSAIYTRAYMASWNANVYALDWPQCSFDEDWQYQYDAHLHQHAKRFMQNVINHEKYDELNMNIDKEELVALYQQLDENQMHQSTLHQHTSSASSADSSATSTDSYLPCIEYNMADWLNLAQVQEALHVKPTQWAMCSDPVWNAWPDSDYDAFVQEYYMDIIDNYSVDKQLKLCVYSGDDDSVCGLQGTQYWLDRFSAITANKEVQWQPWEDSNKQLGGFYTQYMREGSGHDADDVALHFITVRTAGHMVPTTEGQRALDVLRKYLYQF